MPFMVATAGILRVKINWLGKHTLFKCPYGWFMRLTGGIAVDRRAARGLVSSAADIIGEKDKIHLAVAASGTRGKRDYWKSGFYHIATEAQVPIVCGFLDYGKKECGLGLSIMPTGDIKADMDQIRAFYADKTGKFPEKRSRIRLRAEDELDT
jgi:1-acyl-sn-glycerol-3-phosphate acyltransferase